MANRSNFVKTNVAGSLTLRDYTTPTALELAIAFDQGNLTVGPIMRILNEFVAIERRGRYVNTAFGNRVYPTFSFTCWVPAFQDDGSAPGNIATWLLKTTGGAYDAAVSSLGAGASVPFLWDLVYNLEGTEYGDGDDHDFTLTRCEGQIDNYTEAADGCTFAISGTVRGGITGDLIAAEIA